ncbi:hypothetical protein MTR67_048500 [Solanum verrucosum]|uniref:Tf2-1-like SH3-like domain-containing protein n=1 Tax=Solanum verrucosum TaxID=315347 RepID=A0AAF0ZZN1_SOLVR|nr:hypothetical protein MTR67_048500 [Solanum verrucosum]
MAQFEAPYGRRCRYLICWFDVGGVTLIDPELVHEAMEKVRLIRERLKMGQSRQKSYADVRRRNLEFDVYDWVYLKISPIKGEMRFGKKGKLSPYYVGQFQILRHIGKDSYELDLPNNLASVHPIFHVSLFKKCVSDLTSIVPLESLGIKDSLSYEEFLVGIFDQQVRKFRNNEVAFIKVLWRNQLVEGATWEDETDMMSRYPPFLL